MKNIRTISFLILTLTLVPALTSTAGEPLTDTERQRLLDHLDHTRQLFLDSVADLTDEQWHFKEAEDRWSIAQCAEHIVASETFIRDSIEEAMKSGEPAVDVKPMEDQVLAMITDRSQKFQAPEPLQPSAASSSSPKDTLKKFKKERAKTKKMARKGGDLRATAKDHPVGFTLDSYGWFIFLSGHTQRHTLQIEEVKAAEGFPKG